MTSKVDKSTYDAWVQKLNWHLRIEHDGFEHQRRALDVLYEHNKRIMQIQHAQVEHWLRCASDPASCPIFPGDTKVKIMAIEDLSIRPMGTPISVTRTGRSPSEYFGLLEGIKVLPTSLRERPWNKWHPHDHSTDAEFDACKECNPVLVIRTIKPTRAVEVMRDTTAGVEPDFKFRRNPCLDIEVSKDDCAHNGQRFGRVGEFKCARCGKVLT